MDEHRFLIETLGQVSDALAQAGIPYALAGGLAFSALVEPRATVDIDLVILAADAGKKALTQALGPYFDALLPHPEPMVFARATIWRMVGIKGDRELLLDFLLGDDAFHRAVLQRKRSVPFHGHNLSVVTLEDLYLLKRRADRPQDRVDIATIEHLKGVDLDRTYIDRWLHHWTLP